VGGELTDKRDDRAILVTGAGSGIGREIARRLALQGVAVAVLERDRPSLEALVDELRLHGCRALGCEGDASDSADVRNAVDRTLAEYGRLDAAVANAGIDTVGLIHQLDEDEWARGLAVNVTGVFLLAKYSVPALLRAPNGSFLAIASAAGIKALAGNAAYSAAKHAVVGLVKSMAVDYAAQGLRCNVVCPGFIETPMVRAYFQSAPSEERDRRLAKIAMGRFGLPEEVAAAVDHLLSPEASYVTGIAHVVDGGAYAGYLPPGYR
jgi:meso-butanediol dehydrogenase / (S,S)-butanediol dehydrogenase / diacetyl reductase